MKITDRAAWVENRNIGDDKILVEVLSKGGFDGEQLLKKANEASARDQLKENTTRAIREGACGVPSFQVNGGDLIWGQDRLDVVADLLCGFPAANISLNDGNSLQSKL